MPCCDVLAFDFAQNHSPRSDYQLAGVGIVEAGQLCQLNGDVLLRERVGLRNLYVLFDYL